MNPSTLPAAESATPASTAPKPYEQFVSLLREYSEACHRLAAIEIRMNARALQAAETVRVPYTTLTEEIALLELRLEEICRENPTWFAAIKKLKTPYGEASLTKVTNLVVLDEDITLRLLAREQFRSIERRREQERTGQPLEDEFDPELYMRRKVELNKEALEALDDATLARLGISREERQSFSVKPTKVDMGKLAKQAAAAAVEGGAK